MKKYKYYAPLLLQKLGYAIFFVVYKIFVSIEIRGKENLLNMKGPIILALNHTSELDVPATPLVLPFFSPFFPIYYSMVPIEKYKTFGWRSYIYGSGFLTMLGGYSIFSGYKDYAVSLEDHINLINSGHTLCIFPEGKRTLDGKMNPARGGLGYLVYSTGAAVIPIAIDTFFNMSLVDFFTRKRKVVITILKPMLKDEIINISNPAVEDFKAATQKVLDVIKEKLIQ